MTGTLPTTSFGRRTPSLAQLAAETRTKLEAGRASEPVHKWRLYRTLTEAKAAFGLPDGTLTVLHALLAFHAETALTLDSEDPSIVVFPWNCSSPSGRTACRNQLFAVISRGLLQLASLRGGTRRTGKDLRAEAAKARRRPSVLILRLSLRRRTASRPLQPRSVPTRHVSGCCGRRSLSCAATAPARSPRSEKPGQGRWGIRDGVGAAFGANPAGVETR